MDLKDTYRYLVGGYYGIMEMDEYGTKEFILKDIEDYIKSFIDDNPIDNFDYEFEAKKIESELPLKRKLQDSLLVLPKVDAPIELILLVKKKLKELNNE